VGRIAVAGLTALAPVLTDSARFTDEQAAAAGLVEPLLRAARALALHRTGRTAEAAADLARLAELAAVPDAPFHAVSLWREVEAALQK
jgi:hypothetical protein